VEDLIWELNINGYYTVGYADDMVVFINGKFLHSVSEVLQTALRKIQKWCERTNLCINPYKTVIIPFTRKRNIRELKEQTLFSKTIQLSSKVKYLGLTLNKGLIWKKQLDKFIYNEYTASWICRGTFWKIWGLKPKVIYTAVVRPIVTYAATVWWPRVKLKTNQAELSKLQRMACFRIT
jgi:hypothetical protein